MSTFDVLDQRDPDLLLERLRSRTSERKLLLFACSCARRVWPLLRDARSRWAVEVAERFVDGQATRAEREAASRAAFNAYAAAPRDDCEALVPSALEAGAAAVAYTAVTGGAAYAALLTAQLPCPREFDAGPLSLLDDIFDLSGAEVRIDPAWLAWEQGTVVRLARAIYDQNAFALLPYLGDALEEAGCTDQNILTHARSPRMHVRGCWLVDLLLQQN